MAMATTSSPSRVLLVDDDPEFFCARSRSFSKTTGPTGWKPPARGRKPLRRLDEDPEIKVLVTDLSMPGMDGMRLLQEVKTVGETSR